MPYKGSEVAGIAQQRRLAAMLRQRAMTPGQGQNVGGIYVPPSPVQGLAQLFSAYKSKSLEGKATERESALEKSKREQLSKILGGTGGPGMQTALDAYQIDPNLGGALLGSQLKQQELAAKPAPFRTPVKVMKDGVPTYADPTTVLGQQAPPSSSTNVEFKSQTEYGKTIGKTAAERDSGLHDSAKSAVDNLAKLDEAIVHLETSDAITGMGADMLKGIERFKVFVAGSKAAGKKVSDTEYLDALLGSDVFPMIKALGIGARGMDTPAEREFLRQVMTGTISMNKATLVKLTKTRRDISQRIVDKYNKRVDSGELDRFFEHSGIGKQRIEAPSGGQEPKTVNWTDLP